jgi:hypothetical protein
MATRIEYEQGLNWKGLLFVFCFPLLPFNFLRTTKSISPYMRCGEARQNGMMTHRNKTSVDRMHKGWITSSIGLHPDHDHVSSNPYKHVNMDRTGLNFQMQQSSNEIGK